MKKAVLCIILCLALLLCGCGGMQKTDKADKPADGGSAGSAQAAGSTAEPAEDEYAGTENTQADANAADAGENSAAQSGQGTVIDVYVSDDTAEHFVVLHETVQTPDANGILDALKKAGTVPEDTKLLAFSKDGGALTLDLSGEFGAFVRSMGTSGEYMLLGSLVNTYLAAMGADTLTLLSDGAALETGHNVYDTPMSFFDDNV